MATDRRFTGQREEAAIGLYDYAHPTTMGPARYYDPVIGRFIQADTIVPEPGNPQALNRYAYVYGNPLRYTDPSGHLSNDEIMQLFGTERWEDVLAEFREGGRLEGRWGFLSLLGKLRGPSGHGVADMARLYESSGARPWGRFDSGYPNAGDTHMLTLSAAEINGQVTLLEHFGGGETQRISAYKAGLIGDVWVGGAGDKWTRRGTVDYGHGFLTGNSGSLMITANENFDSFGAACDSIGLISDSLGFRALSGALSAVDIARSWNSVGIAFATGAPRREKLNALGSLTTDFVSIIFPPLDVLDLYTTVRTGIHIDRVP